MAQNTIAVAGGANLDIGGTAKAALNLHDSNPGLVRRSPGGVARNIAHNLALLDLPVKLYTALGDDADADRIVLSCVSTGMELCAQRVPGASTSVYLYIEDADGDMVCAVSDMEVCAHMTPAFFEEHLEEINACRALVMDTNLPEESVRYLAEHVTVPVFADPVSVTKAEKLRAVLPRLYAVKPNLLEASRLSGVPVDLHSHTEQDAAAIADALLRTGVQRVFLSLGKDGVLAADASSKIRIPAREGPAVSHTGAGDAFMAGLVYAYCNDWDLADSANLASAAAMLAIQSAHTINPKLSAAVLEQMLSEQKQKE